MGAEALIRWNHPTRGFLFPDSFIQIAEGRGMVEKLGAWVLREACRQMQSWRIENDFKGCIAVNVSANQFMADGFIDDVIESLKWSGLPPEALELEITEHTILEHADKTLEKLQQIVEMDVSIAIDDFGVGYSSFNYLKQMPAKVLKIDASFVHGLPEDKDGAAIIEGIIQLGHNLNMTVVAEGVETLAQYQFLQQHQCDIVQGYLISKPLPVNAFRDQFINQSLTDS